MDIKEIERLEKKLLASRRRTFGAFVSKCFFSVLFFVPFAVGRIFELFFSLLFIVIVVLPMYLFLVVRRLSSGKTVFKPVLIFGRKGRPLKINYFNFQKYYLRNCSLFIYVLFNKMSLVGLSVRQYSSEQRVLGDSYLFNNRPGIFNLWYIRESSRIGHAGRIVVEQEYIFHKRLLSDLMLILKSIPAALFRSDASEYRRKINIFGVDFMNLSMNEALEIIDSNIKAGSRNKVFFVNPDCLNKIFKDTEYYRTLKSADYIFPDGIGVNIACKMIHCPLKENVNGTDMLPFLCRMSSESGYRIFLLGGKPGIAAKMKLNLENQFSGIKIVGEHDGFFDRATENDRIITEINRLKPDILLVAFGVPLQEKWITENLPELNCSIVMGVGGLFDFYSGNIRRAPVWMREIGLEWVFRLIQEPERMWRRYVIGNPLFILRVLKWKICEAQKSK